MTNVIEIKYGAKNIGTSEQFNRNRMGGLIVSIETRSSIFIVASFHDYIMFASFHDYMSKSVSSSIYLEDTNPEEIRQIIMDFKNGKASDLPIVVLKNTARLISPILSVLYNNHMREGVFPSIFKTAKVTPIYKKDNRECIENYRPVSILPIFGKIFEKLIYNRLYRFLSANGILHDEQFGFRKNHSTVHALHQSVQSISSTLAKGKHVLGIFIDLSKAFDTLDHGILLEKLNRYGIRGTALKFWKVT